VAAADPATRTTNPYSFFVPGVRPAAPGFQPQQQFYGSQVYTGFGYTPTPNFGGNQFAGPSSFGGGYWQQLQGDVGRQLVRFAALPILVQTVEVETAISWITNCWPVLLADGPRAYFLLPRQVRS
jgi:hypothetical protein